MFGRRRAEKKTERDGRFVPVAPSGPKLRRRSGGWANALAFLKENETPIVMDVGPTSPSNVNFLTQLGCSIFLPDPLHDVFTGDWEQRFAVENTAERTKAVKEFLHESFNFSGRIFDCVLLWDTLDLIPEPLLQPLVDEIYKCVRPGGKVLAIFNTRQTEVPATHRRFHVTGSGEVDAQAGAGYKQLRMLQNRQIEKLFHAFSSSRFMLAGDNLREVVATR